VNSPDLLRVSPLSRQVAFHQSKAAFGAAFVKF